MIHKNKKFNQIDIMKILKVKMKSKSKKISFKINKLEKKQI